MPPPYTSPPKSGANISFRTICAIAAPSSHATCHPSSPLLPRPHPLTMPLPPPACRNHPFSCPPLLYPSLDPLPLLAPQVLSLRLRSRCEKPIAISSNPTPPPPPQTTTPPPPAAKRPPAPVRSSLNPPLDSSDAPRGVCPLLMSPDVL